MEVLECRTSPPGCLGLAMAEHWGGGGEVWGRLCVEVDTQAPGQWWPEPGWAVLTSSVGSGFGSVRRLGRICFPHSENSG